MKGPFLKNYSYLKKDTLLLVKRKKYLYLFILLPLVIATLFLFALNPKEYDIKVGVCDFDKSDISNEAFSDLDGFSVEKFDDVGCLDNLKDAVGRGDIDIGIEIGEGFSDNLDSLKQSKLVVYYDNTDIAFSNLISWKVDQSLAPFEKRVIEGLSNEVNSKVKSVRSGVDVAMEFSGFSKRLQGKVEEANGELKSLEEMNSDFLTNPIWTEHRAIYDEDLKKDAGIIYIFPILCLFIILMLASTSIIYDKNNGFIERVRVSSNPAYYIFSKIVFFTSLVLLQFLIIMILFMAYGAKYAINPLGILELVLFVGVVDSALGLIVGLIANNEGIAVLFSLMISFPLMLVSGIFFPVQALPRVVQWIGSILPLHYQIDAARSVLLFGEGIGWDWGFLGVFLVGVVWWLVRRE